MPVHCVYTIPRLFFIDYRISHSADRQCVVHQPVAGSTASGVTHSKMRGIARRDAAINGRIHRRAWPNHGSANVSRPRNKRIKFDSIRNAKRATQMARRLRIIAHTCHICFAGSLHRYYFRVVRIKLDASPISCRCTQIRGTIVLVTCTYAYHTKNE